MPVQQKLEAANPTQGSNGEFGYDNEPVRRMMQDRAVDGSIPDARAWKSRVHREDVLHEDEVCLVVGQVV